MTTTFTTAAARNTLFALLATWTVVFVSSASAAPPKALLVNPTLVPGHGCYELPRFGFSSFNVNGYGERVTSVRWGSLASQMGIERGDVILRLNGYPLSYHGSWSDALREAMNNGGYVQLTIRDVRTGMLAHRETYVGHGGGIGPIVPKSHITNYNYNGPNTFKKKTMPHNHPHHNTNNVEQIKQIVDLFSKKNNP